MAQIQDIVVNNGSSEVTFTPAFKDGLTSQWSAAGASIALQPSIRNTAYRENVTASNRRVRIVTRYPFESTDLNGNKTVKSGYCDLAFVIPQVMATTDVVKLRNFVASVLANNIIVDQIDNGHNPY